MWTHEEEAANLRARFAKIDIKRAQFAREFGVPGGQSMIFQHLTGRKPISMAAAEVYARGFKCSLEEISPRLAAEVKKAALQLSASAPGANLTALATISGGGATVFPPSRTAKQLGDAIKKLPDDHPLVRLLDAGLPRVTEMPPGVESAEVFKKKEKA